MSTLTTKPTAEQLAEFEVFVRNRTFTAFECWMAGIAQGRKEQRKEDVQIARSHTELCKQMGDREKMRTAATIADLLESEPTE